MTEKILLADEQVLFRSALRVALGGEGGLRVVGETSDLETTITTAARVRPDLVLLAWNLSGRIPVAQACRRLQELPRPPVVLAVTDDDDHELLLELLDAGALGYVTRDSRLSDLVHSVRAALRGEACIPRLMLGGLLRELVHRRRVLDANAARIDRLSQRERQVLRGLAAGDDGDAIAAQLFISPQTVRTHIQNVLAKLQVHSRLEAADLAREYGLDHEEAGANSA